MFTPAWLTKLRCRVWLVGVYFQKRKNIVAAQERATCSCRGSILLCRIVESEGGFSNSPPFKSMNRHTLESALTR